MLLATAEEQSVRQENQEPLVEKEKLAPKENQERTHRREAEKDPTGHLALLEHRELTYDFLFAASIHTYRFIEAAKALMAHKEIQGKVVELDIQARAAQLEKMAPMDRLAQLDQEENQAYYQVEMVNIVRAP